MITYVRNETTCCMSTFFLANMIIKCIFRLKTAYLWKPTSWFLLVLWSWKCARLSFNLFWKIFQCPLFSHKNIFHYVSKQYWILLCIHFTIQGRILSPDYQLPYTGDGGGWFLFKLRWKLNWPSKWFPCYQLCVSCPGRFHTDENTSKMKFNLLVTDRDAGMAPSPYLKVYNKLVKIPIFYKVNTYPHQWS